jgi:glyoxylase-like metal-dependent hydrolase (beta-lactamase superfamily II)
VVVPPRAFEKTKGRIMKTTVVAAISFAMALAGRAALAQQDLSQVEIQTQKLADTVYMMTGAGGNLGLSVGEDAVFLIDDQFAPLTPRIQAAIAKITDKPVKFVLNTHWHFDHTGGNENLGGAGALIIAHENVRKRLSAEGLIEFFGMKTKPEPKVALPVITFTRDLTFHINGDELFAHHVARAHTDGDAIIQFKKSNVIHMGDTFFNRLYPFIDTSSGGTVGGVIAAADLVLRLADDDTKIIPGHGPLGNKADLEAYREMLATVSARVRGLVRQGRTLEQVVAAKPTAKYDEVWGKGFLPPEKFVAMLYGNLKR